MTKTNKNIIAVEHLCSMIIEGVAMKDKDCVRSHLEDLSYYLSENKLVAEWIYYERYKMNKEDFYVLEQLIDGNHLEEYEILKAVKLLERLNHALKLRLIKWNL